MHSVSLSIVVATAFIFVLARDSRLHDAWRAAATARPERQAVPVEDEDALLALADAVPVAVGAMPEDIVFDGEANGATNMEAGINVPADAASNSACLFLRCPMDARVDKTAGI